LVWLGARDPYQTREQIIVEDPEREQNAVMLSALYQKFQGLALRLPTSFNGAALT